MGIPGEPLIGVGGATSLELSLALCCGSTGLGTAHCRHFNVMHDCTANGASLLLKCRMA